MTRLEQWIAALEQQPVGPQPQQGRANSLVQQLEEIAAAAAAGAAPPPSPPPPDNQVPAPPPPHDPPLPPSLPPQDPSLPPLPDTQMRAGKAPPPSKFNGDTDALAEWVL